VYPVTLQFEAAEAAVQVRVVLLPLVPEADNPVGALGGVEQLEQVPCEVHGWPLPGGPLFVAGS
jgi:hypothetical protein